MSGNYYTLHEAYLNVYGGLDEELTGSRLRTARERIKEIDRQLQKPGNENNPTLLSTISQLDRVARSTEGSNKPVRTNRNNSGLDFKYPTKRGGRGFKGGPKTLGYSSLSLDRPPSNNTSKSILKAIRRHNKKNPGFIGEQIDAYDLVLDYLLDEGYCESVENAENMMAHMSEEWIESIIDEAAINTNPTYSKNPRRATRDIPTRVGQGAIFGTGDLPNPQSEEEKAKIGRRTRRGARLSYEER